MSEDLLLLDELSKSSFARRVVTAKQYFDVAARHFHPKQDNNNNRTRRR